MKITRWLGVIVLSVLFTKTGLSQQLRLGNNPTAIEKSAVLELQSTNQGLLFSRIADTALINAMNPSDGMVIYFIPMQRLLLRANGYWQALTPAAALNSYWNIEGNSNGAVKKFGTIDNYALPFITNNTERMRITNTGRVGIGNAAPTEVLDVTGNFKFSGAFMPAGSAGSLGYVLISNGPGTAPSWVSSTVAGSSFWTMDGNAVTANKTLGTTTNYSLPFITNNTERMRITNTGNVGIGTSTFDASNAEKLLVDAGNTSSFNVISGKGSINNYLQLNIQNRSNGNTASSDIVASADNGNESVNFVDLGINSSGFTNNAYPILNGINNGYLYSTGNDFVIGNATSGKYLSFFTGGTALSNERMRIDGAGKIGIGNTAPTEVLDLTGNFKFSGALMPAGSAGTAGQLLRSGGAGSAPTWSTIGLTNLAGVSITSPVNGQIFQYNGTNWINATPTYLTTVDTGNIANFYQKVRGLFSSVAPITLTNGQIGITQANTSTNGYLSSTDWNTFNNKLATVDTGNIASFYTKVRGLFSNTGPITLTNGLIGITQATASTNGYLSSADWNMFNTKLNTIDTGNIANFYTKVRGLFSNTGPITLTNGLIGITQATASTSGYLSSANWNTFNNKLSTVDTGNIASFYTKVRGLFSNTGPITLTNGLIGITQATTSTNGYLSSADWNMFNTKLNTIDTGNIANFYTKVRGLFSNTGPITLTNGLIGITQANTSTNGYLSSTDWNTFNTKLSTVDTGNIASFYTKVRGLFSNTGPITLTNGLIGITQATASTSGYLSSANWNTFNNKLSTVDTGNIANFYTKVRGLFSAGSGITYNSTTGLISAAASNAWNYGGNTVTVEKTFGTIDNFALPFLTNNTERMRITNAGSVGIGTNAPNNILEVTGTNTTTGVSGLRLTNLGTATTAAANSKVLSVNATGDVIVTNNPASTNWLYTGNAGINPAVNFLGTTDDKQMILKSNSQPYMEFGRRQTLGLTQGYPDYENNDEKVTYIRSALQFEANGADFYKPKMYTDVNGNFRIKGSAAGTDFFELGSTGAANNGGFEFIIGDDGDEAMVFKSYHYINGMSEIMRLQSGRMAVGSNAFDATNPEKLLIDAGNTTSYNLMTGKGSIDNYLQINVQNRSAGTSASSDLVATSNNGSETSNFVDMGINGGSYNNSTYPILNGANNAYLYSTGNDMVMGNGTAGKNFRFFTGGFANTNERMRIDGNGSVGIGATAFDVVAPEKLLIDAGVTTSYNLIKATGNINNYLQFNIQNESAGINASTDIVATNNTGTETSRFIDMGINSSGFSNTGILGGANNAYLYSTGNDLIIGNATAGTSLRFFAGGTATTNEYMRMTSTGFVGIGTTVPGYPLDVERSGGPVASFNRTTSDGTIVSLQQAGIEEGTISVIGNAVSYNAFTGSHYAHTAQPIDQGMLVTLTGENEYLNNNEKSEIIYGIRPSATANDAKIMGAFLGLQEGTKPYSISNPNLVMAVGNGVMWVADKGENLAIGDYLISSDIAGHAMKENGTYATAFVIARVAEPVSWAQETAVINGVKHKLVSVFFESFVKNNAQKELETLKQEMNDLKERMLKLEKLATQR